MAAVAHIERVGVPVDVDLLNLLRSHWDAIKLDLVAAVDAVYGVYHGVTFKADRFARWVAAEGIGWPCTDIGRLHLDRDTFHDIAKMHPQVAPLGELRHALSDLRLESVAVGADGRNRVSLMPFGARTGRNTPSTAKFIFGSAVWLRSLIRPPRG